MSGLNGPPWDEATRDDRIASGVPVAPERLAKPAVPRPIAAPPPPSQEGNLGSSVLTIAKVISAARWKRAEDAFYKNVEVTRHGGIQNLRGGILAAIKELLS